MCALEIVDKNLMKFLPSHLAVNKNVIGRVANVNAKRRVVQ